MSLFVECKSDQTLALAVGVPMRLIEHAAGRGGVCSQLARRTGVSGLVDEDPGSLPPSYMKPLIQESWEHEVRLLLDTSKHNRVVVLSPRLEGWIVRTAKSAGLKMTDFGFDSDDGVKLHGEINQRLGSLSRLVETLIEAKNPRILRLRSLLLAFL